MHLTLSTLVKTAGLVLSLGFDTFAVAVGLGVAVENRRSRYRFAAAFAVSEGIMPLIGFSIGAVIAASIGDIASYLAIALLLAVGVYMLHEAREDEEIQWADGSWPVLLGAALSVSLDELAAGFSLGLLGVPVLLAVGLIAVQAFVLTLLGTALGRRVGEAVGRRAELLAGCVLVLLALFLLAEKTFSR